MSTKQTKEMRAAQKRIADGEATIVRKHGDVVVRLGGRRYRIADAFIKLREYAALRAETDAARAAWRALYDQASGREDGGAS